MSRIRANQIVNQNNNGAPVFPKGAVINGISTITADVSLNTSQLNGVDANFSGIGTYGVVSLGTGTSISSPSDNVLVLGTNDTEAIRVTSTGSIGINTTTVTAGVNVAVAGTIRIENPSDSSQTLTITHEGIDFQNTGAGSSTGATSHLLDDYEEGEFTPKYITSNGGDSGISHLGQFGSYVKIGNLCHVQLALSTNDWTTGVSGDIRISGLPFVVSTIATNTAAFNISFRREWAVDIGANVTGRFVNNDYIFFYKHATNSSGSTNVSASDFADGGSENYIYGSGTYIVD